MNIFKKLIALVVITMALVSCQFTETLVLNEDGTGTMAISMDLSEMMAFSGEMAQDSTFVKQDTVVSFKDLLEQKKDSIAQLPMAEQKRLKAMENYKMRMVTDPETNKMVIDIFTDFKNISEANDLMKGFEQSQNVIPGASSSTEEEKKDEPDVIGVSYSYAKGKFKRDAFIKDKAAHKTQVDSLKNAEAFMTGITYKVKYTFPRKIKKSSVEDATFSLDGKTLELQRSFVEYIKNPDILDIEVELEK
ncbi:MAG TPA: hypothetical protein DCS66_16220 [Flavobacteriaceae bacterium]|jgi:hypothetical protein|nr:hypothetical protein [Flavobacteriaceae bacterium]HAT66114.1 hypothetical protein [Flavobacteriaceae bacterium]|tara:strand:- start:81 stop:824 length:744 start_codon:yes stop_codon:yes gene_type:complete